MAHDRRAETGVCRNNQRDVLVDLLLLRAAAGGAPTIDRERACEALPGGARDFESPYVLTGVIEGCVLPWRTLLFLRRVARKR